VPFVDFVKEVYGTDIWKAKTCIPCFADLNDYVDLL